MSYMTFKYAGSTLVCDGNLMPVYANRDGDSFFTFPLDRPEYSVTNRDFPAVETTLDFRRIMSADRSDLLSWWLTELEYGRDSFTLIDHHRRLLFDVTWDSWAETWRRDGRGVWDVPVSLVSPYGWTPRTHALYPMLASGSTIADHLLTTGNDMALGSKGTLVNYATSGGAILRRTGYALRLTDDNSTAPVGATGTPTLTLEGGDGSISLFCQFRIGTTINDGKVLRLVRIGAGAQYVEITVTGTATSAYTLSATWDNGAGAESITLSSTSTDWADVAFTYDAISGKASLYLWPSADAAMWVKTDNYLDAQTTTTAWLATASTSAFPVPTSWTSSAVLQGTAADLYGFDIFYTYLQNVWILDSFVSPRYFNTMRRLCYNWNFQTVWVYPL